MFKSAPTKIDEATQAQLDRLNELATSVAQLVVELKRTKQVESLEKRISSLKEEIANFEIDRSRQTESFEREKREIQHHIALEKKRQEFEIETSKREASLDLREENLSAERDQFQSQMEFYKEQMGNRMDDLKVLYSDLVKRMPNVNWNIEETRGTPALTVGDDDDE
jgi:DNA repair exonuclease SbcCD ATPase subunit